LGAALLSLEYDGDSDTGFMAWTAGRELDQQLDWNWLDARSFQGQCRLRDERFNLQHWLC